MQARRVANNDLSSALTASAAQHYSHCVDGRWCTLSTVEGTQPVSAFSNHIIALHC